VIIEFTKSFDRQFSSLAPDPQVKNKPIIDRFISSYASKQFPNGLRVYKCGPFVSLSVSMNHRIFVFPIPDGIQFVFAGDHEAAGQYLKQN